MNYKTPLEYAYCKNSQYNRRPKRFLRWGSFAPTAGLTEGSFPPAIFPCPLGPCPYGPHRYTILYKWHNLGLGCIENLRKTRGKTGGKRWRIRGWHRASTVQVLWSGKQQWPLTVTRPHRDEENFALFLSVCSVCVCSVPMCQYPIPSVSITP